ncbi:hypothetical protein HNQ95_005290 [Aminobacter ciceronei]|jgi:hypothetical protein|uniref:Uncharacterized protein n=2 Tax=Aminobacter TaxID=31988 RepID=A0AAC8YRM0_AMIAI|nr:hypothetical protein AA2016_4096 [Aminobacter aminovorans]MBA8909490.1 hypothetical protein [Aminobacter ciceronei]MBA9023195.1 hypothetical protein [Aminobacter ciceronei]MBB3704864.1 hypothetical protein [Aminobacter aminovorans]
MSNTSDMAGEMWTGVAPARPKCAYDFSPP